MGLELLLSIQPCLHCWDEKPGSPSGSVGRLCDGSSTEKRGGKGNPVTEAWGARLLRFRLSHYIVHLTSSSSLEVSLPDITLINIKPDSNILENNTA